MVLTMVVGLEGPVTVRQLGREASIAAEGSIVLIPRGTAHTSTGGATATFFYDPRHAGALADAVGSGSERIRTLEGKRGRWIAEAVRSARDSLSSPEVLTGLAEEIVPDPSRTEPSFTADERVSAILTALMPADRASGILEQASSPTSLRAAIGRIATRGAISDAHLRALFVRDHGVQLRTLLRWFRLSMAVNKLLVADVTTAAHTAGFADLAHFSRTCRAMLGACPSELIRKLIR
jgi:AraC-like DNA-binding protein